MAEQSIRMLKSNGLSFLAPDSKKPKRSTGMCCLYLTSERLIVVPLRNYRPVWVWFFPWFGIIPLRVAWKKAAEQQSASLTGLLRDEKNGFEIEYDAVHEMRADISTLKGHRLFVDTTAGKYDFSLLVYPQEKRDTIEDLNRLVARFKKGA
jgi:hypothetical protein